MGVNLYSGSGGAIFTSTDSGATWHQQTGDSTHVWLSVASSANGTKLAAACSDNMHTLDLSDPGYIYTSTDSGASWSHNSPASHTWKAVASSADGTKLVAVQNFNDMYTGGGLLYTSADSGATWINQNSTLSPTNWSSVASSADGSKLVAVVYGGQIYISWDYGVSWLPRATAQNWTAVASSADGTKLVVVAMSGQIYTSSDSGVTWSSASNAPAINWSSVASSADGSKLVAVADYGGQICTSTDSGVTWTTQYAAGSQKWTCVASSADGTKLIAAVDNGYTYTSVPVSTTPNSTTTVGTGGYLAGGQGTAIELQYIGNNQFMPISYVGSIFAY